MLEPSKLWPLLEARARATPDALCCVDERGERLSFAQLRARAERVAAALVAQGIGPGVRVSWQLPTWIQSVVLVCSLASTSSRPCTSSGGSAKLSSITSLACTKCHANNLTIKMILKFNK